MGTYTVKEIAEKLNTNPETVRRWIRSGKLKAEQSSRKEGNVISEEELQKFISVSPKFNSIMPMLIMGPYGIAISRILEKAKKKKKEEQPLINTTELNDFAKGQIANLKIEIKKKKLEIEQCENDIKQLETQIEHLEKLTKQEGL